MANPRRPRRKRDHGLARWTVVQRARRQDKRERRLARREERA